MPDWSPSLMRGGAVALSVALALGGTPATAQQAEGTVLDPIVIEGQGGGEADQGVVAKRSIGASKTSMPLKETPQAVSVVTREQIELQGSNSVAEALRYTPGLNAEPNGYDIRYDWLHIRGINTHGTVWLDGLIMPGDPSNYATPSIHPFTLDRVEVIKGPASVLYGRTIPSGLVNMVSKRPQATPHRELSVRTSAFGGVEGSIDMTGPLTEDGEWQYRLLGLAKNMHTQIDMERDRKLLIAPSLTWSPSEDTSLTLYGYYQRDRDIFNPRFYPAVGTLLPNPAGQIPRDVYLGDPNANQFNRDYFHLGYEFSHRFNETWSVRQNLRYGRSEQDMFLALVNPAFAYDDPPSSVLQRVSAVSDESVSSFAVDTQAEAQFSTGGLDHTLLFGVDYVDAVSDTAFGNSPPDMPVPPIDFLDPEYGFRIPRAPITRAATQKQDQVGLYVQDQIRYDRWVALFGMRYDFSDVDTTNHMPKPGENPLTVNRDEKPSVRLGLTYLFDNGLAPYVSYSTSFLPLMGRDKDGVPFTPQTAEQFEIGVKYEPVDGNGMIGVSLFDMAVDNILSPNPKDTFYQVQGGKQRIRGVELEGKYEVTPQLDIMAAYAYSDSEVLESTAKDWDGDSIVGRETLGLPRHQASVWAAYRPDFAPGLTLMGGVRAISSYQTDAKYDPDLRIPGRTLVDVGAQYDLGQLRSEFEGTKFQLNVTNLFDEKYVTHCLNKTGGSCNYGAGRAIWAGLNYSW